MSSLCSICRKDLPDAAEVPQDCVRFGLCEDCRRSFETRNSNRNGFGAVLERYSEPVVVVDSSGRLVACNRLAEGAVGRPAGSLLGLLPGEVLECKHASEAAGCGKTGSCGACALRLALNYTVAHGRGCEHLPVTLDCTHKGKPAVRRFTLSTQKVGDLVRVMLEDDGYLPAY